MQVAIVVWFQLLVILLLNGASQQWRALDCDRVLIKSKRINDGECAVLMPDGFGQLALIPL